MSERRRIVLVAGADLMARARLDGAAGQASFALVHCAVGGLVDALRRARPDVVVLDLDAGREPLLEALEDARAQGLVPASVLGFYSHVDAALGSAAEAAGCRAYPRGRFWRDLPDLLAR